MAFNTRDAYAQYACNRWLVSIRMRLSFNANKSKSLLFGHSGHKFCNVDCHFVGNLIEQDHEWPHQELIISYERNDTSDILNWQHCLCGHINNVICYFSNRNSVVKHSLMNAYCSSLYGCELWESNHPGVQNVSTSWKRGLRRIWGLPYDSHSKLFRQFTHIWFNQSHVC